MRDVFTAHELELIAEVLDGFVSVSDRAGVRLEHDPLDGAGPVLRDLARRARRRAQEILARDASTTEDIRHGAGWRGT